MRRIVIALILLLLAGLTATAALAGSSHVARHREPNCPAAATSTRSVSCRGVLIGLAAQSNVTSNSSKLPYDEFGLTANQPSQPRVGGTAIPTAGPATGLVTQAGVTDDSNRLPYDEFGLAANRPSQPQVGASAPETGAH